MEFKEYKGKNKRRLKQKRKSNTNSNIYYRRNSYLL